MELKRIFDFIHYQNTHFPQEKAFSHRINGNIVHYSTQQIIDLANQVSKGLLYLGLKKGDTVAMVSAKNRPEWTIMDLGMAQVGVINVPVYPNISQKEYEYIFNDAEVKYCFIGDDAENSIFQKIKKAQNNVPSLRKIFVFDENELQTPLWNEILIADESNEMLDEIKKNISPDDLATIIYTSGTTGEPKGVMLSHFNIVSNVLTVGGLIPMKAGEKGLSFLPICHIFERAACYAYMMIGANVFFTGTDNLGGETGDLKMIQPHFFTCVPRLLEKVYEKIYNKGLELKGIKRALFFWALRLTDNFEYDTPLKGWAKIQFNLADKLIFTKWRAALGGNIKGIVVGASPCPVKIARTFSAAGIPIREGYGLTEMAPGISFNEFKTGRAMLGTVGKVIDIVELQIDASDGNYAENEGEILVTGVNVMLGYYKKLDKTDETIKIIGGKRWLCTGDIGKIVTNKHGEQFLKITDRKKELFKTSGGKYVAPAPIENRFKENFLIEQIMVVGDNQKFVSALILPAVESLKDWCKTNRIAWTNLQDVIKNSQVIKEFQSIIDRYNQEFNHIDQIKQFRLIADTWETTKADGKEGELTPTLKLKRRIIIEKYKNLIDEIYGSSKRK